MTLKQGIADGDFEEIVLALKRSGVWISEEIIKSKEVEDLIFILSPPILCNRSRY